MKMLQSFIYGLISGISEFMPISSYGHQVILRQLFGISQGDPLLDLLVHLALLTAVILSCRSTLRGFQREMGLSGRHNRSRRVQSGVKRTYDLRLLITAAIPMLAVLLMNSLGEKTQKNALLVCLFFVVNGVILYITEHLRQSNKDASQMTGFDAILIGLFGGLSVFPGISRVGVCMSLSVARGADKSHALNWALILSIPALILLCLFDVIGIFGAVELSFSFISIIGYLLAVVGALSGGYFTIMLMRFLIVNTGFAGYACYSWGMSMLVFILYLIA